MKKLITTCALLTAVTMVSFAQSKVAPKTASATTATTKAGPSPEQYAERTAKVQQATLGLSAEEYTKVYAAELDYQNDLKRTRDMGAEPGPGQSMQMGMARDQKYKAAMTPEHYAKYEATKTK